METQVLSETMPLDSEVAPLLWLLQQLEAGNDAGLLTVTGLHGGSPRPIGTHMAVVSARSFNGYLSGGCVEAAIACEVVSVIEQRSSRVLRFGRGSPIFDIQFPCGGGIDVLVSPGISIPILRQALEHHRRREPFSLAITPADEGVSIIEDTRRFGWVDGTFFRPYLPATRLLLAGRGPELEAIVRLAVASGFGVDVASPDLHIIDRIGGTVSHAQHLRSTSDICRVPTDPWTATVLLFHEREWEDTILKMALSGPGFYIGALGSERTQTARRQRLLAAGHDAALVDRVVGPIGLISQARDPATLAISVLAEIAISRRNADRDTRLHG